jgi:hypothetical protein
MKLMLKEAVLDIAYGGLSKMKRSPGRAGS